MTDLHARDLLPLARLALALGREDRVTYHEDGNTPESVTDHTVMVGLVAVGVAQRLGGYDVGLVAQYALVHDLAEAICGDTDSYAITDTDRAAKEAREAAALVELRERLSAFPELVLLVEAHEAQEVPEARLVRFLDKVAPKLVNAINECAGIRERGRSAEQFCDALHEQHVKLSEEYPEMADNGAGLLLLESMVLALGAYPLPS